MHTVDRAALQNLALTTPATTLQVDSAVDHPSTWLEILDVLPCQDEAQNCLYAEFGVGQKIVVRVVDLAEPVRDEGALQGSRRFGLQFTEGETTCGAQVELGVKATADHLDVTLSLLSAEDVLLSTPLLATGLALALPNILKSAANDVIATVHQALSSDLEDTAVTLHISMPNAQYTELLAEAMSELSLQFSEPVGRLQITFAGTLADAPVAEPVKAEAARTLLTTAQRLALAVNLVTLREARGLKQLEVAHQALGFAKSHAAVSRLERGILNDVETERLERLASFFDTDVATLLGNDATSCSPTQPGEGEGLSIFDPDCDFTPSTNYGRRLTLARTSAGLSLQALSKKLGHMHEGTVSAWEQEKATPRRTSFIDLAMALEVPVSWLMFGRRVATPARGMALRLTAMQKLYGLSNGEVAALMESTNDEEKLIIGGRFINRLSVGRHGATTENIQKLAGALQVPVDWISPPDMKDEIERERLEKVSNAVNDASPKLNGLSKTALKLVTDIIELIEMGIVTDSDVRQMRADLVTKYTTPYIRRRQPLPMPEPLVA
jgi:transcriptional regulator with XRE-family HTH domain